MRERILAAQSGDKLRQNYWWSEHYYFQTADGARAHKDGRLKIVYDSKQLQEIHFVRHGLHDIDLILR
jgi:hypothetical protein